MSELYDYISSEVIVSVTKQAQTLRETPAVVSIITSQQIRAYGYRNVAEALQSLAGVDVLYDYLQYDVGIRGNSGGMRGWSRVVKVMIDGQPVMFRPTSENWTGEELVPIDAIERIEVVRSPASALYGANAFLGVINIITVSGGALDGGSVRSGFTSQGGNVGYTASATAGTRVGAIDVLLAASHARSDRSGLVPIDIPGRDDFASTPISQDDIARPSSVLARADFRGSFLETAGVDVSLQSLDSHAEFQDYGLLTHENRVSAYNVSARARAGLRLGEDLITRFTASYSRGAPHSREKLKSFQDRTVAGDYIERDVSVDGFDFTEELMYALSESDSITLGADQSFELHDPLSYRYVFEDPDGVRTTTPFGDAEDRTLNNFGVYAQSVLHPLDLAGVSGGDALGITAGVRLDVQNIYGSAISYRAAGVYQISERFYGKLLFGTSFKAPAPAQLFTTPLIAGDVIANPELDPERAKTGEILVGGTLARGLRANINSFVTIVDDKVELRPIGNNVTAANVAETRSVGLEAEIAYGVPRFDAYANLTYQNTKVTASDDGDEPQEASLYPNLTIKTGGAVRVPEWYVSGFAHVRYTGPRVASRKNISIYSSENFPLSSELVPYSLDGYLLVDLGFSSLGLELLGDTETSVSARVANLLDTAYVVPGFTASATRGFDVPGVRRTFLVEVQQSF